MDPKKRNILLGECKFRSSSVTLADFTHMQTKFTPAYKKSRLHYALFSESGFTDEVIRVSKEQDILLITPEMLVE